MNKGILYAAAAYIMWGFFPIYFKIIHQTPAVQITAHRFVWSFLLLMGIILVRREFGQIKAAVNRRTVLIYLSTGALLAFNWLVYVWAVNAGLMVEASLGYFINPLVSVLLGVIFLRERLRPLQWLPVILAGIGVTYLTLTYGSLPWVSLALAFSFGFYGLIKKLSPLGSLPGLTLETASIFIPALAYLIFEEVQGAGTFGHIGPGMDIMLIFTGAITAAPLLLFAAAAHLVPLSTIGLMQYFAPSLQFLLGVFVYNEPFDQTRLLGFSIIWLALIIFSGESIYSRRKAVIEAAA